ncbi:MAG: hypothetical protein CTY34_11150 [Methylobacter sp.]|nr:MAG: hypothetical protein CTY34_11150 [Methylobacter sp.]
MKTRLRSVIKKNFSLTCAYYLLDNFFAKLQGYTGTVATGSGTVHRDKSIESSLTYIETVFNDYKLYSGKRQFNGRVAEVGPGDNLGVGLLFLADGCESVDLVDRFFSKRNARQHATIYRALIARHAKLLEKFGDVDCNYETAFQGLQRFYGKNAAAERFFTQPESYDLIVSRAVFEHVYNPQFAIKRMAAALKKDGVFLHKVDFRDHGMFSEHFHELAFFEVPEGLYARMTRDSGRPNRVLIDSYRRVLGETLPDHTLLITRLAGVGDIVPHLPYEQIDATLRNQAIAYVKSVRANFSKSLRSLSDEDLSVAGIFIVAHKN